MAEYSVQKPFAAVRASYSPLENLIRSALVRAGNFSPARVDGEVMMMMLELANRVVEDARRHPYWIGGDIDYYTHQSESRSIPDLIMIDGLTAHYMIQQGSEKSALAMRMYQSNMSDIFYERSYGNASISINIKDGGSNKAYKDTATASSTTTTVTTTTVGNVHTVTSSTS